MAVLWVMSGVPYIIMVLAVQRIETTVVQVAVIFTQLAMGMLIDNFEWLGNESTPLSILHEPIWSYSLPRYCFVFNLLQQQNKN